jgi:hypothetical protein
VPRVCKRFFVYLFAVLIFASVSYAETFDLEVEDDPGPDTSRPAPSLEAIDEEDDASPQATETDLTPADDELPPLSEPTPRTSGADSELGPSHKVFDWEKHRNKQLVPHPFAEKGLLRITRERNYLYRIDPSEQKRAASLRVGSFLPQNLENPEQAGQAGATFEENYDQTDFPAILFDYEWQMWRMPVGKLGLKVGTGAYVAQGNGHFVSEINAGLTPREIFTFVVIPANVGAIYRMHFGKNKQLFVPYGEGGGTIFGFTEFRDDNRPPKFGGAPAAYFGGGLAIDLTYFDYMSRIQLDREYGINAVYLNIEYRGIVALSNKYDFSADLFNGGFTMEF